MSRIDPNNVVVLVRDSSDAIVRIGVSSWQDLREVIRPVQADDERRFKKIETEMGKAMKAGVAAS